MVVPTVPDLSGCGDPTYYRRSEILKAYRNKYPTDAFIIYPDKKGYIGINAYDWLEDPGIGNRMGAMILAEVGDFSNFDSPDKILAYAGLSPSTYQSGQLVNCYSHMEKRGSRYLRYAIFNATKYVCHWDPTFAA